MLLLEVLRISLHDLLEKNLEQGPPVTACQAIAAIYIDLGIAIKPGNPK